MIYELVRRSYSTEVQGLCWFEEHNFDKESKQLGEVEYVPGNACLCKLKANTTRAVGLPHSSIAEPKLPVKQNPHPSSSHVAS